MHAAFDLDRVEMANVLSDFQKAMVGAEMSALYFAGHGIQVSGQNYLIARDATLENDFLLEAQTIRLQQIISMMETSSPVNLVFVDACRDNPFVNILRDSLPSTRSASVTRGLARVEHVGGPDSPETMVVFAAASNDVALDGDRENSPFAQALAQHLKALDTEISVAMKRVIRDVREATQGEQSPEIQIQMSVEVYLNISVSQSGDAIGSATDTTSLQNTSPYLDMLPHEAKAKITSLWDEGRNASKMGDDNTYYRSMADAANIASQVLGEDSLEYGQAHNHLIGALTNQNRISDAVYSAREAIRVFTKIYGANSVHVARDKANLAARLRRLNLYDEAEKEWQEAIEIFESRRLSGWDHIGFASALDGYAQFLAQEVGKSQDALEMSRQAIAQNKLSGRHADIHFGWTLANAGHIENQVGSCTAAKLLFEQAVQAFQAAGVVVNQRDHSDAIRMAAKNCVNANGQPIYPSPKLAISCVQKQLVAMGYRPGSVDGKLGPQTVTASEAYRKYMKSRYPGWNQESITISNSEHWCRHLAVADGRGSAPYQDYMQAYGANGLLVTNVLIDKNMISGAEYPVTIEFDDLGQEPSLVSRVCFEWHLGNVGPQCTRQNLKLGFGRLTVDVEAPRRGTHHVNAFIEYKSGGRTWITNMYTNKIVVNHETTLAPTTANLAEAGIQCEWNGLVSPRLKADGVDWMGMFVCDNGSVINGDELYVGNVLSKDGATIVIDWIGGPTRGPETLQVHP